MRRVTSLVVCGFLFVAATSRSDVAPVDPPTVPTPIDEPITGAPITPAPGTAAQVPPKDPFSPYAADPGAWRYQDLSADEQAVAERGRDATGWAEVNAGFASATGEQAKRAAAEAAATQLGVSDVAEIGVVP